MLQQRLDDTKRQAAMACESLQLGHLSLDRNAETNEWSLVAADATAANATVLEMDADDGIDKEYVVTATSTTSNSDNGGQLIQELICQWGSINFGDGQLPNY